MHQPRVIEKLHVPFEKSFEGCIEKYFANKRPTLYACVPVWYLAPGGVDPFKEVPAPERFGYWLTPPLKGGVKILGMSGGTVEVQDMAAWGRQMVQRRATVVDARQPGNKLDLAWPVDSDGRYDVSVALTKARDYAVVQLYIDGKKTGEPIDLYNPTVIPTGPISLGSHELTRGELKLTVEIVGANDKADKSYMFGLDRIITTPAK